MRAIASAVCLLLVLISSSAARAHTRSVSYSRIALEGDRALVRLKLSALDQSAIHAALGGADLKLLAEHLPSTIELSLASVPCVAEGSSFERLAADSGWARYEWFVSCPRLTEHSEVSIRSTMLAGLVPSHLHFSSIEVRATGASWQALLSEERASASFQQSSELSYLAVGLRFLRTGFSHILDGLDHLVFLLVLIVVAGSLRELATTVTGFTLGHSMTLALAATGFISPSSRSVEALIGLTIALVAVENVWQVSGRRNRWLPRTAIFFVIVATGVALCGGHVPPMVLAGLALFVVCYFGLLQRRQRPEALRWPLAALFGAIHGLAFSSVLQDLRLSDDEILLPLVGFNLGVELGQLTLLVVVWPLLSLLRRYGDHALIVEAGSAVAISLGLFWFLSRAYL